MPPVILAFAGWAGISIGAAYLVAATVVLSAGMAVYGAAQARRAEQKAKDDARLSMKDRMATRIATEAPHRYVYGRAKIGCDVVAMFTSGDRDQFKHLVCVHAAHECDAIEEVYIANKPVGVTDGNGFAQDGSSFARPPDTKTEEQVLTGPTLAPMYRPIPGTFKVFSGTGASMVPVALTSSNDATGVYTIAQSTQVTVVYDRPRWGELDASFKNGSVPGTPSSSVRVSCHLGGANDPVDYYLNAVMGNKWPATAVLRGLCYTVVTLDLNNPEFQGGVPPVHAIVRGKKLYDPRDGQTRWSQNVALAMRDYLTGPLCGVPAADLPNAQFITAANVCDEVSPTGGARYTINGTVTSDQGQASVLESMTQAMAGGLVATTWDVYAGKYVAPVAALVQSDIVGNLSVTPGVSDASIYNGVRGQYIGPENKYVQTDFKPYQNSVYRVEDGRDLYTNIDFPFTESLQRVTNLARIFTEDQRNGFTIRAEFSLKAWPLKVGQRITFTSAVLGHNAKVFRITDKSYSPTSAVQLTLKEDDASIWDYADATVVDSTPNSDLPDPWKINPLVSLSCTSGEAALLRQADGTTIPRILVAWPATAQPNGVQIEVEWRAVQSTTWERTTVSASETRAYLSPITPGFFYVVRARVVNPSLGIHSNAVATVYQVEVFTATPTVYMYAANKPATPAGTASYSWPAGTFGAAPAGWSLTIPAAPGSGNVNLWAATVALSDVSDVSSSFDWAQAEVRNIGYAPSAAGQGPAGYSNARVFAYQRKATAPAGTPGAVDYDFSTGAITTATLLNGWQKTIPASDGNPLYVTSASASAAGGTDTIASAEWSGAVVLAYDGGAGTPGMNSASVTLYQRNNTGTAPALPSAIATYTFSPPGITGLTNGWTAAMPAATAGKFLFATTATAASTSATDAIAAGEWAPAQILAQDGGNGVDGIKTAVVYAYQRSAGAPAGTPGAVTYDFAANAITTTTLANGWQKTIPAANGNPLYVTAATASGTGATDSITGTEWSGAVVLVADGNAGAPGLNNATVSLYQRTASATAPALPNANAIYTFATGAITGLTNGWNTFIPNTGGQYLHRTQATAIGTTATDTIPPSEWAAVQLMYDAADLIAAKAAADAAIARADAAANDGILDRSEKADLVSDWVTEDAVFAQVIAQANALGVNVQQYVDNHNATSSYLLSLNPGWSDTSQDTPIDRTLHRNRFKWLYEARQIAQNAIAAKASTVSTWSGTAGRPEDVSNLVKKGNFDDGLRFGWDGAQGVESAPAANGFPYAKCLVTHQRDVLEVGNKIPVTPGETLYFSAWMDTTPTAYQGQFGAFAFDKVGNILLYPSPVTLPARRSWTKLEGSYTVGPNVAYIIPWVCMGGTVFNDSDNWLRVADLWIGRHARGATVGAPSGTPVGSSTADAVVLAITNIASDNVLSKGEKSQVIREWLALDGEQAGLVAQTDARGVSHVDYDAKKLTLKNYLLGLSPGWSDTTQDTPIVGDTFRTRFTDVYVARQGLINAMAAAAATTSTWAGTNGPGRPADYATVGAPAGTQVAGVDAATVAAGAQAGASLTTPFSVSIGGDVSGGGSGKAIILGTRTAQITGQNIKSILWTIEGSGLSLMNYTTATVTVRSNVGSTPTETSGVLTVTAVGLDGRSVSDKVNVYGEHA